MKTVLFTTLLHQPSQLFETFAILDHKENFVMVTTQSSADMNVGFVVLPCTVLYSDAQNASIESGEKSIIFQRGLNSRKPVHIQKTHKRLIYKVGVQITSVKRYMCL